MPKTCRSRSATASHASVEPSVTSMRPIFETTRVTSRSLVAVLMFRTSRRDEPRPVSPFERDFLIVNDDDFMRAPRPHDGR